MKFKAVLFGSIVLFSCGKPPPPFNGPEEGKALGEAYCTHAKTCGLVDEETFHKCVQCTSDWMVDSVGPYYQKAWSERHIKLFDRYAEKENGCESIEIFGNTYGILECTNEE